MYVLKARILDLILKPAPPPTLLYTTFDREGTLFVYLLLKNGAPFTYLTAVNVLYIWTNRKNQTAVSRPFHSHKMRHLVLLGHFTNRNDKFPNPYIYFNYWIPCPFHIPGDWKRGFSPYRQLYPPPPSGFFPGTWYLGFLFLDLTKSHNSPIIKSQSSGFLVNVVIQRAKTYHKAIYRSYTLRHSDLACEAGHALKIPDSSWV